MRSIKLCLTAAVLFILSATTKGQITALENSGAIPKFDQSTDIKGPDSNANGIREDVDAYIAAMAITSDQKKSIEQFARSIQATLIVDTTNATNLREASANISRAVQCVSLKFPDIKKRTAATNAIESITTNTNELASQYIKFNTALSGSVSKLLSGDTCNE